MIASSLTTSHLKNSVFFGGQYYSRPQIIDDDDDFLKVRDSFLALYM